MKLTTLSVALSLACCVLSPPPVGAAELATSAAAATAIPAGNVSWGVRAQLREDNLRKMASLYGAAARGGPGVTSAARKVGDYFMAQMDLTAIEQNGLAPLRPTLDRSSTGTPISTAPVLPPSRR